MALPTPTPHFVDRKTKIVTQLSVPDSEYSDASPKGSVDVGIRDLIKEINDLDGLVTTSSCAGRVSIFVEGRKSSPDGDERQVAGVGGKGAGGTWLFVSHDPVSNDDWMDQLKADDDDEGPACTKEADSDIRWIHFKFEPMILHVLTASLQHAQLVLRCALQAGFRESGALNLTSADDKPMPMVGIRTMGLGFESLIGRQVGGRRELLVSPEYLHTVMDIATQRFAENAKRIDRFLAAFRGASGAAALSGGKKKGSEVEWEDAEVRRERKRAEGLRRKAEIEAQRVLNLPDSDKLVDVALQADGSLERL